MQKYCRKMKKRRVNFSLLRAIEVGNTEALLSILWASVVRICTFGCRPLACGRVSTSQWTTTDRASLISCLAAIYLPNWGAGL